MHGFDNMLTGVSGLTGHVVRGAVECTVEHPPAGVCLEAWAKTSAPSLLVLEK